MAYRALRLPRRLFAGKDLAGVGYLRELGDYGIEIEREGDALVTSLRNGLRFESPEGQFIDALCMLSERFVAEEYSWLEVAGRVVIDVGANIADSVLYFSRRGAVHVYGYEPDAANYAAAARNVNLNKAGNVTLTQAAVVGRAQPSCEYIVSFAAVMGVAAREYPGIPVVCKIDCEGCEYEILAPDALTDVDLRNVAQLMIEYHWRSPQPLRKALEVIGFEVETATGSPGTGWIRARRLGAAPSRS